MPENDDLVAMVRRLEDGLMEERDDAEYTPEPMCACDVGLPHYCTPEHPPYA